MIKSISDLKKTLNKPIVFIGLMGCGKTQIGRLLAKKLHWQFYDSDDCIIQAHGCSIPDIFEQEGEAQFRKSEKDIILDLLKAPRSVISTGGGAVMTADVEKAITQKAISIWLDAPIDTLIERTEHDENRPLLQGHDAKERLQELYDLRKDTYVRATIHVNSEGSKGEVLQKVISALNTYADTL